jgi:hypothetical protein
MASVSALSTLPRRFLSRDEAARWLGMSVDTFMSFRIPACDLGPRCSRWDIIDIEACVLDTTRRGSARTSAPKMRRRRQICVFANEAARRTGGSHGTARTESEIAEVPELKIESQPKRWRQIRPRTASWKNISGKNRTRRVPFSRFAPYLRIASGSGGIPLYEAMQLTGHKSLTMVQCYDNPLKQMRNLVGAEGIEPPTSAM